MVQIFELQNPLHAMAEANLNGAALFDVAGKSKDPERDLSALSAAARYGPAGPRRGRTAGTSGPRSGGRG